MRMRTKMFGAAVALSAVAVTAYGAGFSGAATTEEASKGEAPATLSAAKDFGNSAPANPRPDDELYQHIGMGEFSVHGNDSRTILDEPGRKLFVAPTSDGQLCYHVIVTGHESGGCFKQFPSSGVLINVFDRGPHAGEAFGIVASDVSSVSLVDKSNRSDSVEIKNGGFWVGSGSTEVLSVSATRGGAREVQELK